MRSKAIFPVLKTGSPTVLNIPFFKYFKNIFNYLSRVSTLGLELKNFRMFTLGKPIRR